MSEDAATSNDELSSADSLENLQTEEIPNPNRNERPREVHCAKFEFNGKNIRLEFPSNLRETELTNGRNNNNAEPENMNSSNIPMSILNGSGNYHKIVFLDDFNHGDGDCIQRINALVEESADLRNREASLIRQIDVLNKIIGDFQTQPHLFSSTFHEDAGGGEISPCSSRSERSLSSHYSTLQNNYALDVFAENNRLLRYRESANRRRDDVVRMMQTQIDGLERNIHDSEAKCHRLTEEFSSKEVDFKQTIDSLEKDLSVKKNLIETFIAQNNHLGEEYNDLLKQKSNWQSKIDELKQIRRTQQEYDDEIELFRIEIDKLRVQLKVSTDKFNDLNCDLTNSKSILANKSEELNHLRQVLNEKSKEHFKEEYEKMKQNFDRIVDENGRLILENDKMASKMETMNEMERVFVTQNLGLPALKKSLESKDETAKELRRRCEDLEQVLDENLREKEQKSATIIRLQEQVDVKSKAYETLQSDFSAWQADANAQYEDTCRTYDEKICDLHSILRKYTDYPGKVDTDGAKNATDLTSPKRNVVVECNLDKEEIEQISRRVETLTRQLQESEDSHLKTLKNLEVNAAARLRDTCATYEDKLNVLQKNLRNISDSSSIKYDNDLLSTERKKNAELSSYLEKSKAECDSMKDQIIELTQINRSLTRRCDHSDHLHEQAIKTIEALRAQYDEEREHSTALIEQNNKLNGDVEYLRREKINVVNEADLSSFGMKIVAHRMRAVNNDDNSHLNISLGSTTMVDTNDVVLTLRERLSKVLREKQNLKLLLNRTENQRRSLIAQKKYLQNVLENCRRTEAEALSFLSVNGYLSPMTKKSPPSPTSSSRSKFRKIVYTVLASIRIRRKYEKIRNCFSMNSPRSDNMVSW